MRRVASLVGLLVCTVAAFAELRPARLQCDYRDHPLGVDTPAPRLSWIVDSTDPSARALRQTAYQILAATTRDRLEPATADLWDSGKVLSDQMAHVPYPGKPLSSHSQCWWTVRVWDQDGQTSRWSEPASWTAGVLDPSEWQAKWISASADGGGSLPLLRHELALEARTARRGVSRALVYVCGLGSYELRINGRRIGDQVLDPGWTNYRKRCLYSVYDVTAQFQDGDSGDRYALGVLLGNGLYNVRGGRYTKFLGSFGPPKLFLQLHVEFGDGSTTNIVSDASWKTAPSPITFSCIYGGEDYDARLEQPGWDRPGFADNNWQGVRELEGPGGKLVAQSAPPVKVMETFHPVKISQPKPGVFVYDLGRNFSGWPAISLRGPGGDTVKLIPGELLDSQGLVSQRSSGGPVSFSYTLRGPAAPGNRTPESAAAGEPQEWHPRFSYYGFRYLQVEGAVPADRAAPAHRGPVVLDLAGQFIHSSAKRTGSFICSDELLNRIDRLILAAIESNLQSVLTDCPHREKLGWLEVSHLLGPAILFDFDVPLLYRKICDDMEDSQLANGLVPDIAPEYTVFQGGFRDSPEWGSASVINPWLIYQRYGDLEALTRHYDMMARYAAYLGSRATNHLVSHGLGDWYDIGPQPPGESQLTGKGVTATAIYYADLDILRQAAELTSRSSDMGKWSALASDVRGAFNTKFFHTASAQYDRGSQTANAMPLVLGLAEPAHASAVLANLVREVRAHGNQVTAGDVGFRFLVEALRRGGRSDVLFDLVTRREGPGYADQLRKGATTLTEAWDANPASSQNHCMLGHAQEWFYTGLAGINPDPAGPGFRKFIIKPQLVGSTRWVRASYDSISGRIESAWSRTTNQVQLEITVPPNTSATVYIPTTNPSQLTESGRPIEHTLESDARGEKPVGAVCQVGSGRYTFVAPWSANPPLSP